MRKWPVFQTLALNTLMLIYTLTCVLFIGKIVISRTPKQCAPRHLPMEGIVKPVTLTSIGLEYQVDLWRSRYKLHRPGGESTVFVISCHLSQVF